MVHLTKIRRALSFAKVVRGLQFPEICHLLLHPRLWLQELGELLRPVALTLIYLSPLFFFTGCAALVVADLAAKGIVYANEKQGQQQGTSGTSSSNEYVFCPNTNSYKYGGDGNCAQPEEVARVVLPTVPEPTGLFKGFTPDEQGTNLDAPNPDKAIFKKPFKDCPTCPEMVVVPKGRFLMGSSTEERAVVIRALADIGERNEMDREGPQHQVQIQSFAAGRYAVTRGEFAVFVKESGYWTALQQDDGCNIIKGDTFKKDANYNWRNTGFFQADDHPVVCVGWVDAQAYVAWLSRKTSKKFRLFSEAEWEYMARGGTQTAFWLGPNITTSQANYNGTYGYNGGPKGQFRATTVPVNSFIANPFGIYNVHGNVQEWVEDCWHENYLGAPVDGSPWSSACKGQARLSRNGSFLLPPLFSRAAYRGPSNVDVRNVMIGFRVARDLSPEEVLAGQGIATR